MTLTTKQQHEKDRQQERSEAFTRCTYCDTSKLKDNMVKNLEGQFFCDSDCQDFFMEEVNQ